jgi:hypothetical protein
LELGTLREAPMKRIAAAAAIVAVVALGLGLSTSAVAAKSKHHAKTHTPTAAAVYREFVKAGLPVSGLIVYTAATDPNHLLGRPTGYISKCAWVDARVPSTDTSGLTPGDIGFGGGVEVFRTAAEAKARAKYIFTIDSAAPILGSEYDYLAGRVLVRVSQYLTPTQAATYAKVVHGKLYTG